MADNIIMKLYNNPCCEQYEEQDCYLLYISNIGVYISTEEDTFKLLQERIPDIDIMDEETFDKYASARGFKIVARFVNKKTIQWHNGYESKKEIIRNKLKNISDRLMIKLKYLPIEDKSLKTIYILLNLITKLMQG